jgi:hypothetical protein
LDHIGVPTAWKVVCVVSKRWFTKVCVGIILWGSTSYVAQEFEGWSAVAVMAAAFGVLAWTLTLIGKAVTAR